MVCPRGQRSGRTSIRATTRSFPASVNVTPFNSAKGIFIELTFSSGVMTGSPPVFLQLSYAGLTKPGNDFRGRVTVTTGPYSTYVRHASIPSPSDRVSHRRDRGDPVPARRAGPDRRRLRPRGAAAPGQAREAAGIGIYLGGHSKNPGARAGPRSRLL